MCYELDQVAPFISGTRAKSHAVVLNYTHTRTKSFTLVLKQALNHTLIHDKSNMHLITPPTKGSSTSLESLIQS